MNSRAFLRSAVVLVFILCLVDLRGVCVCVLAAGVVRVGILPKSHGSCGAAGCGNGFRGVRGTRGIDQPPAGRKHPLEQPRTCLPETRRQTRVLNPAGPDPGNALGLTVSAPAQQVNETPDQHATIPLR